MDERSSLVREVEATEREGRPDLVVVVVTVERLELLVGFSLVKRVPGVAAELAAGLPRRLGGESDAILPAVLVGDGFVGDNLVDRGRVDDARIVDDILGLLGEVFTSRAFDLPLDDTL